MLEESRRPSPVRATVPTWVDTVNIAIRLHTYRNSKRISAEMRRRQIYDVSPKHIDQLFQQLGCSRGTVPPQPGPRYERSRPNKLWHIDIKGPFFIHVEGSGYIKPWIVGLVDDQSRFMLGLRIHTDAKLAPILDWLDDCFELWGQPIELMSDNGSPSSVFYPGLLTTDIASGFARSPTVRGPLASRHRRSRRVPLDSAWNTGSSSRSLTIRLMNLPATGLTTSVLGPQVQLDEQNRLPNPPIRQDQEGSKSFT